MSQNSKGPKKFQLGPRRKVPSTISDDHSTAKPNRNSVISAFRSLNVKYPFPLGLRSMYGMQISPTMIRPGNTTPAIHGSKYTSISCSPRKYHGAFDGFGVLFGLAGSSSGASMAIDHTVITVMTMSDVRNSSRTRYGQVWMRLGRATSLAFALALV